MSLNKQEEPKDVGSVASRFGLPETVFAQGHIDGMNNFLTAHLKRAMANAESGKTAGNFVGIYELVRVVAIHRDGGAVVESPVVHTDGPRETEIF